MTNLPAQTIPLERSFREFFSARCEIALMTIALLHRDTVYLTDQITGESSSIKDNFSQPPSLICNFFILHKTASFSALKVSE